MHMDTFILLNTITLIIIGLFSLQINSRTSEIVIPQECSGKRFPSYQIESFNGVFNLSLIKDEKFLSPIFLSQYFNQNQTWIDRNIEHCFYQGYVNDDPSSFISISLCNGLFGTFFYDNIEYFIEPKYQNFEHLLYTNQDLVLHCSVDDKPHFEENSRYTREKREFHIDPTAKHVEILIAYDHSFREFHADIDVKSYILTLFNYVSHLYSDASIGNHIKIWVVKLIELGRDFSDYIQMTDDAADILIRFCQWQRDYNIPGTYDAAVLLTRIRLCNQRSKNLTDGKCDTLGLTELGAMCNLTSSCAVVRDNGFATAFSIAHEIAHLFGIRHDNDQICLNLNKEQNLMATSLIFNHNHYKWSNCSRFYFTQYLESNRYPCLNNIPDYQSLLFKDLNYEGKARELPGYWNDLDDQCRRAFGIHFEYCKDLSHGPKCIRLYCQERSFSSSSCITNHAHWSDGTICSDFRTGMRVQRCFRGQCRNTEDLRVINGGWGEWLAWSSCTRTCGSAVQKSQRFCDNPRPENGGRYCSGQSTRIRACEDNPMCEDSLDTFRQRQCSRYNNHTIDPALPLDVRFEPKYNVLPHERCKLICKVSNDRLERSFIFKDRVEDGTPCNHEDYSRDICINGVCISFGCDNKLGSNATEDVCGICNGQNQTCKLINGRKIVAAFGITDVVHIPFNTTRVSITQISPEKDRYYLAVKHPNGTYLLNGLHHLQMYPMKIRLDTSTLSYTGFESSNESILIIGRLKLPLDIQVISMYPLNSPSSEVYWEYYTSFDGNEICNRPCESLKPIKRCHDHCLLNWTRTDQGICSARCGDGFQHVVYQCTRMGLDIEIIDDEICRKYVGEKPKTIASCVGDCKGIGWVYGEWSECHDDGGCVRKRLVECRNSSNLVVSNNHCDSNFISNIERCADIACVPSKWNFSSESECDCMFNRRRRDICAIECLKPHWQAFSWQTCTPTCSSSKGLRHRRVVCVHQGLIVQDDLCDRRSKPVEEEWCTTNISCLIWFTGEWSSCSSTCGQGREQRRVYCSDLSRPWLGRSDDECWRVLGENSKPSEERTCSMGECPYWKVHSWSRCLGKCGLAKRYRRIQCLQNGTELDEKRCLQMYQKKPLTIEVCEKDFYCPKWISGIWSECSVTCGIGTQQRPIVCKHENEVLSAEECDELGRPARVKQCRVSPCQKAMSMWMISDWTQCDLRTCLQTRTSQCVDSVNQQNVSRLQCAKTEIQPPLNRICPIPDCVEWHVAHWHGCPAKCGFGMEDGSGYHCYSRQIPLKRLNISDCESAEPPLVKPISRRICRRNCVQWRPGNWVEVTFTNHSSKHSLSLLLILTIICVHTIRLLPDSLLQS